MEIRAMDARGHQLVRVRFGDQDREFTYAWAGEGDLTVGDKVETPIPYWITGAERMRAEPGVATVCALGSDYTGTVTVLSVRV